MIEHWYNSPLEAQKPTPAPKEEVGLELSERSDVPFPSIVVTPTPPGREELERLLVVAQETVVNIEKQIKLGVVDWLVENGYLKKKWSAVEVEMSGDGLIKLTTRPLDISNRITAYLEVNGELPILRGDENGLPIDAPAVRLQGSRVAFWVRGVIRGNQLVYEGWLEFSSLEDLKAMVNPATKNVTTDEGGPLGWLNPLGCLYSLRREVEFARKAAEAHRAELEESEKTTRKLEQKLALVEEAANSLKERFS